MYFENGKTERRLVINVLQMWVDKRFVKCGLLLKEIYPKLVKVYEFLLCQLCYFIFDIKKWSAEFKRGLNYTCPGDQKIHRVQCMVLDENK